MVITRTPLRISFVGGGSDRPSFYSEEPGACVAASIDKYVYVTVSDKYDGSIRVAYSVTEDVTTLDLLQHELAREALKLAGYKRGGVEIHSIADIPGGTGLGSSSSFTVGLLRAIEYCTSPQWLAMNACHIEINECHKPIGKQDQYAAAFGGLNLYGFSTKGVTVSPIECDYDALGQHCLLLDTGMARQGDAGAVLAGQQHDHENVHALVRLVRPFADALAEQDFELCGAVMDDAWSIKRRFVGSLYDQMYQTARQAGAWGGKLCGAGGGGFLLFLAPPERHGAIVSALGLRHVPIRVGVKGCEGIYHG